MIVDSSWIGKQAINLWFEFTQEEIAEKLKISVGKVNSIIQEYISSNDWAVKARDIFMSAKKNGVEEYQLIANLRYESALKKFASERDKLEIILKGLGQLVADNVADPNITANLLYQILELVLKEHKSPREILDELQSSIQQDLELEDRIQHKKQLLKKYNFTPEEIVKFSELRLILGQQLDVKELNQIRNLIANIREHDDLQRLIGVVSKCSSLSKELQEIKKQKEEELANLADIDAECDLRKEAINTCNRLAKRGYSEQGIADILKVVDDFVQEYKGTPNGGNSTIAWLRNDIAKFGSLGVANINLQYENNYLSHQILQSKKRLRDQSQYGQNIY